MTQTNHNTNYHITTHPNTTLMTSASVSSLLLSRRTPIAANTDAGLPFYIAPTPVVGDNSFLKPTPQSLIHLFMQNKPNSPKNGNALTALLITTYDLRPATNDSRSAKTNPIKPNFSPSGRFKPNLSHRPVRHSFSDGGSLLATCPA